MGGLILRGVGMAIGLALWPVALPVAAVMGVAAAMRAQSSEPQQQAVEPSTWEPEPIEPGPVLPGLREQQLALVTERNREHLERCAQGD